MVTSGTHVNGLCRFDYGNPRSPATRPRAHRSWRGPRCRPVRWACGCGAVTGRR
ncbi:hypothetical protein [Streptomyces malaysiensis]|uniref:hypothetical protein n=1 Tax=Streptomyces malaysiensis TaxID=92644 RepID=UPI003720C5D0